MSHRIRQCNARVVIPEIKLFQEDYACLDVAIVVYSFQGFAGGEKPLHDGSEYVYNVGNIFSGSASDEDDDDNEEEEKKEEEEDYDGPYELWEADLRYLKGIFGSALILVRCGAKSVGKEAARASAKIMDDVVNENRPFRKVRK
ncbi:hypothetical protein TSAR_015601 [Trichomalopsis sarcophagae]|uniref:Uncharacterized protein n=1 Tax=Trichomalopsis sarcophagae TaxID=543379 RepID=A0A232ELT3_9HYME|nr:hypothetical protein TSAR_015601 [Trichomalopsis sarcophagae]